MKTYDQLFIGGKWREPRAGQTIDVVSPSTEEIFASAPAATVEDMSDAVDSARSAFDDGVWSSATLAERVEVLERFATLYESRLEDVAILITAEMGSPIAFSRMAQGPTALMALRTTLGLAASYPWRETREGSFGPVSVDRLPVGVVGAIVPWNVPHFVAMTKLAPALLAGCSLILKPAPETPLDGLLLAELLEEAGLPAGVLSVVPAGREVGEALVRDPRVDKIAFTGSTDAGRRIAALCGEQLKRCTLELGGKSAAIVLDDADVQSTAQALKFASLMNTGQVCTAQTRILAPVSRYDDFVEALGDVVGAMTVGDPFDEQTEVGPLVAQRQQERVEGYIRTGLAEGARLVVGGPGRPEHCSRGWYVRPTVFADVRNDMRIAQEEIFGPVLCVIPYEDEREAIRIANDSAYGLAGSVWGADADRATSVAQSLRTGVVSVNSFLIDYLAPFGGFKASGIGRELGREGIDSYTEIRSISSPGATMFGN